MKTIKMSFDKAEWMRYYCTVEVDERLSANEQREQLIKDIEEGNYVDEGVKGLGCVGSHTTEYNFPDELGGPTENTGASGAQREDSSPIDQAVVPMKNTVVSEKGDEQEMASATPVVPDLHAFATQLLTVVRDLNAGYPRRELGISMEKIEDIAKHLGVAA